MASKAFNQFYSVGSTVVSMVASSMAYYIVTTSMFVANYAFMLIVFLTCLSYFLSFRDNIITTV